MDEATSLTLREDRKTRKEKGLSYKFQRLRERLRKAIESGELSGKLPGERTLARRFHANAKTLSKALTDLAADGLLDRSIGRGPYVKGTAPTAKLQRPWLLLCDPGMEQSPLARLILESNPSAQTISELSALRPSFINSFCAVIDLAKSTPDAIHRNLIIRNIPLITVGREPQTYSCHCIMQDRVVGVVHLARALLLSGHLSIAVIDQHDNTEVHEVLRKTAAYCAPNATVVRGVIEDLRELAQNGVTAMVCGSADCAQQVRQKLTDLNLSVPQQVCLVAVGSIEQEAPCSGYFTNIQEEARTILQTLQDIHQRRPATLWMIGKYVDRGTCDSPEFQTTSASMTVSSDVLYRNQTPLPLSSIICP
ncbi:MAG: GntR family transcriptional regulator [Phycisphaerales bacterium]|nr:GntR family transcriptional regulator [Phycisphaerales bacterium]